MNDKATTFFDDPRLERRNARDLLAAGIRTVALERHDVRLYLSADRSRLLAWHYNTGAFAMRSASEVLDESARGPNVGVLAEAEQYGATEAGRERVALPGGGVAILRDLEAPDAFDGDGWGMYAIDYEPPRRRRSI